MKTWGPHTSGSKRQVGIAPFSTLGTLRVMVVPLNSIAKRDICKAMIRSPTRLTTILPPKHPTQGPPHFRSSCSSPPRLKFTLWNVLLLQFPTQLWQPIAVSFFHLTELPVQHIIDARACMYMRQSKLQAPFSGATIGFPGQQHQNKTLAIESQL